MTPTLRTGCLAVVGLLLAAAPARADFFVVPFLGMKFGGSTSIVDLELAASKRKLVLGASAIVTNPDSILGFEVEFANTTGYFNNEEDGVRPLMKTGSYVTDLTGSVIVQLPAGATRGGLRPYAVLGGGLIHAEAEDFLEIFQVRRTVPAISLGVGATGLVTTNVGVRFDLRHLRSIQRDAPTGGVGRHIDYWRVTFGLLLRP